MPLHLLGKKSWNVYNADNIARVRRDEALAKAEEEAHEQRMQEVDAQRRLAILRGETPPLLEESDVKTATVESSRPSHVKSFRRKRKRPGEDDADYELRLAKEQISASMNTAKVSRSHANSAPITDQVGHIDLLGHAPKITRTEKNEEAQKGRQRQKQELEDQYTMRFTNAAGKDGIGSPWYSRTQGAPSDLSSRDVWGNEDPRRKERDAQRIVANDPLAMMKQGAARVRQVNLERRKLQEERFEELQQLRKEDRRREKHSRRHAHGHSRHRESSSRSSHYRTGPSPDRRDEGRKDTEGAIVTADPSHIARHILTTRVRLGVTGLK